MELKGIHQLRKHLPDLSTSSGGLRLAIIFLFSLGMTVAFFYWVDLVIPDWMPDGEIILIALAFLILAQFFTRRRAYQQRYGELAYRNAFVRFVVPGLGILFAAIAHLAYMPGPEIPNIWWKPILVAAGYLFVAIGASLWIRSLLTFGADNVALLYVYYPDESRLINTSIYSILRHPIYSAGLNIAIGLAFIHANWYSLVVIVLLPLGFTGWTRLVEEKELITRLPDYVEYRRRVPAFWARLPDLGKFYRFLITGA
jgi:protein-S-isoprenylcysteine O-methyltransferase Ste14